MLINRYVVTYKQNLKSCFVVSLQNLGIIFKRYIKTIPWSHSHSSSVFVHRTNVYPYVELLFGIIFRKVAFFIAYQRTWLACLSAGCPRTCTHTHSHTHDTQRDTYKHKGHGERSKLHRMNSWAILVVPDCPRSWSLLPAFHSSDTVSPQPRPRFINQLLRATFSQKKLLIRQKSSIKHEALR